MLCNRLGETMLLKRSGRVNKEDDLERDEKRRMVDWWFVFVAKHKSQNSPEFHAEAFQKQHRKLLAEVNGDL